MIRLIASDIDGTLVPDGSSKINPEIFDVILKLKEQGIYFIAASGRQYPSIAKLFAPIKEDIFFIAENGAYIGARGRELISVPMNKEDVKKIVKQAREYEDCEIFLSGKEILYIDSKDEEFIKYLVEGYENEVEEVDDLLKVKEEIIKVSIYHKGFNAYEVIGKHMIPLWEERLKVVIAGSEWLDFMAQNVSKGTAIKEIQESLGISKEETMAFGDNFNDIEMLKEAHYSYAIGNAVDEVKEVARFITDTNINDGVLKVLKGLLKERVEVPSSE